MKNIKMKKGMLSAISVVLIIIAVIAANVFISAKNYTFDMTANQLYSISDQTKSILDSLEDDVTIYVINDKSNVNETYARIFEKYAKYSKKIKFEYRSSTDYPNFAKDYVTDTETIPDDSVIVTCKDKFRYISSEDFYDYDYDYYTYEVSSSTLELEGLLTQAIDYVTSDNVPVIYTLTGHSEDSLSSDLTSKFEKDNYSVQELNLLSAGEVPSDCEILMIIGAQKDLTAEETEAVKTYMNNGGKAYIFLDPNTDDLTNLYSILSDYQVTVNKGVVVETDANMYYQEAIYLLPSIESSDATAAQYNQNVYILVPTSKGLTDATADDSTYTVTPLLTTSDGAFSKVDTSTNSLSKTMEDINGPFDLAVAVSDDNGGRMVVCGSDNILLDNVDTIVNGSNSDFVINCANYLSQQESKISIRSKSVVSDTVIVPAFWQKVILAVTVAGIPLLLLISGIFVVLRRRNL